MQIVFPLRNDFCVLPGALFKQKRFHYGAERGDVRLGRACSGVFRYGEMRGTFGVVEFRRTFTFHPSLSQIFEMEG